MCCCCESPQQSEAQGGRRLPAIERHISITRAGADGVVSHTEVHITASGGDYFASGEYFDPRVCCDAHERAMIDALRSYLRPQAAPACLMARLKATLDRCCEEEDR
ncbi:hypothetical protein [Bifidobacterium angulatum]|jgi:hypothetical protein|uniref:hypothetical protein n=1 Tax=Bifidobacterium angulatum TaxID=1683 RepID=UPI0005042377|nr:hypothetical protein [Bifidobacterium angulatum]KFI38835.1 hypothetical protein BIANG_0010 [Bifidobacterium angulatum]